MNDRIKMINSNSGISVIRIFKTPWFLKIHNTMIEIFL